MMKTIQRKSQKDRNFVYRTNLLKANLPDTSNDVSEFNGLCPQTFCSFSVMGTLVIYCCWRKGQDTIYNSKEFIVSLAMLFLFCRSWLLYILFSSWTLALGQNLSGIYVLTPQITANLILFSIRFKFIFTLCVWVIIYVPFACLVPVEDKRMYWIP